MELYTKEWLDEILRKYRSSPPADKRSLYYFATSEWLHIRTQVEEWLSTFPSLASSELKSRLKAGEYLHALYDLATGVALKSHGYEVENEKQLNSCKPDWYVHPARGVPGFIVDVTTLNASKEMVTVEQARRAFLNEIRKIGVGVTLQVDELVDGAYMRIDRDRTRAIKTSVRDWLRTKPEVGANVELPELRFTLEAYDSGSSAMTTKVKLTPFYIDPNKFKLSLEKKVSTYRRTADEQLMPVVIALGADESTGLDLETLKQILYGERRVLSAKENKLSPQVIKHIMSRRNKGLFFKCPELSCVIWVELMHTQGLWEMIPLYNPHARNKLPFDTFYETEFRKSERIVKQDVVAEVIDEQLKALVFRFWLGTKDVPQFPSFCTSHDRPVNIVISGVKKDKDDLFDLKVKLRGCCHSAIEGELKRIVNAMNWLEYLQTHGAPQSSAPVQIIEIEITNENDVRYLKDALDDNRREWRKKIMPLRCEEHRMPAGIWGLGQDTYSQHGHKPTDSVFLQGCCTSFLHRVIDVLRGEERELFEQVRIEREITERGVF
jgi:hypothetical protein